MYHTLVERTSVRISTAYRPKTVKTHQSHLKLLLQFLQFICVDIEDLSYVMVLAFIELLQGNGPSHTSIAAYISSLRSQFRSLGLSIFPSAHHNVMLVLRSVALNIPFAKKTK